MIKKDFRMTYDDVTLLANVFHGGFLEHKSDFIAFSNMFDDPFADNFLSYINQAHSFEDLTNVQTNSFILNHEVQASLKNSRGIYQKLILFLKFIYPNPESALVAFGKKDYNQARISPLRMVSLLEVAHSLANDEPYKTDLIAGGYSQSEIDGLLAAANDLSEKHQKHQEYMNSTNSITTKRIELYNLVWAQMQKINKASKFIYAKNYGLLKYFELKR